MQRSKQRNLNVESKAKGFSLVTVLSMGLIGTMWVAAAYAMLIPLMQQTSGGKQNLIVRTLAESAIDYVSNDIVSALQSGQFSKFDDVEPGPPYTNFELGALQIGIPDPSNVNMRLMMSVKNQSPPIAPNSAFNDLQSVTSVGQDAKKQWSMIRNTQPGWRVIEVKALSEGGSGSKTVFRAFLKPLYADTTPSESPSLSNPSYFPANVAAFGTSSLEVRQNSVINGNLATNGTPLSISGENITVNGDLRVNSLSFESEDVVAKGSTNDGLATINGFVDLNGKASGFTTSNDLDSVQVNRPQNGATNYDPNPDRSLISEKGSADQIGVAPAPSAPADAVDLGAINISNGAKLVIKDGPVSIPQGQSLSDLNSGTATIPPGNYKISSMNVSETSSISVGSSTELTSPAAFFVDSSGIGEASVNLGGSVGSAQSGNFQIWYNGTRPVNISATSSSLSVYAPNAKINVAGGRHQIEFQGALLGNSIAISNAKLTWQQVRANVNNARNSGQPSIKLYDNGTGNQTLKVHGLKQVLWQELPYGEYIRQGNTAF